jgi:hypothetical protein
MFKNKLALYFPVKVAHPPAPRGWAVRPPRAVVAASVLILIVDFFVTKLIFAIFGYR